MKSFTRDQVILSKGVAASILLHGVVLGLLVYAQRSNFFSEQAAAPKMPREYIVVSTLQRRPASLQPEIKIETAITKVQPDLPAASDSSPEENTPQELEQFSDITGTEPPAEIANSTSGVEETTTSEETITSENTSPPVSGTQPEVILNPTSVRSSVTAYVKSQQGTYSESWMSACVIYQKEHGVQDCPQQQAEDYSGHKEERVLVTRLTNSVNRVQRYARMTEQFTAENKELKKLMEGADPVLAELARTRHSLNAQYTAYLNGNFNFTTWAFVQAANSSNTNLGVMRNFLQPICKPSPCIWEYTGFKVIRPAVSDENPEAEFRISTTVLGSSK